MPPTPPTILPSFDAAMSLTPRHDAVINDNDADYVRYDDDAAIRCALRERRYADELL